jgi:hypothetical protein
MESWTVVDGRLAAEMDLRQRTCSEQLPGGAAPGGEALTATSYAADGGKRQRCRARS